MPRIIKVSEDSAESLRAYFHIVDVTDGMTPETGEEGGQPEVSVNGAGFTAGGIGTLAAIGYGRYYADLSSDIVGTAGYCIETRYKSANTAECPGDSFQVVGFDPNDGALLGLSAIATLGQFSGLSTFDPGTQTVTLGPAYDAAKTPVQVSDLADLATAGQISGLSTFDPATDGVTLSPGALTNIRSGLSTFNKDTDEVMLAPDQSSVTIGAVLDAPTAEGALTETQAGQLAALATLGNTLGSMLEDSSGWRWSEKALEQGPAGAAGAGLYSHTLSFLDSDDDPISGVKVLVYSDSDLSDRVAGPLWSDMSGNAVFKLDAGTFYPEAYHKSYTFPSEPFSVP